MRRFSLRFAAALCVSTGGLLFSVCPTQAQAPLGASLLGSGPLNIPTGTTIPGAPANIAEIGGISGITYSGIGNTYYGISDNRATDPSRFYTLNLDVSLSGVSLVGTPAVTALGGGLNGGNFDAEGIALTREGTLLIASESDPTLGTGTDASRRSTIREFNTNGAPTGVVIDAPSTFLRDVANVAAPGAPAPTTGQRNNNGFESLALSADTLSLFTANERALYLDQSTPIQTAGQPEPNIVRILQYTRPNTGTAFTLATQYAYQVEPFLAPSGDRGLVDFVALPGGDLITVERSFQAGIGNTIRVYQVSLTGGIPIPNPNASLSGQSVTPLTKRLIFDFTGLGFAPDNIEGITLGPTLANGNRTLLLVSDNNFSAGQPNTQIVGLQIFSAPEPGTLALVGTASLIGLAGLLARRRK